MLRKVLLSSAALALATTVAHAGPQVTLSKDNKFVSVVPSQGSIGVPGHDFLPPATQFSDIAKKYPNGLYFCCYGNTISGPSSFFGAAYASATQWTQGAAASVTKLSAAVGYVSGTHKVTLTLYADSGNNTPGKVLASKTGTSSTGFGLCCGLVTVKIPSTNLSAGQAYWIGITAGGADFDAANESTTDEVTYNNSAFSSNGGTTWSGYSSYLRIAVSAK